MLDKERERERGRESEAARGRERERERERERGLVQGSDNGYIPGTSPSSQNPRGENIQGSGWNEGEENNNNRGGTKNIFTQYQINLPPDCSTLLRFHLMHRLFN